jgi:pyridoxamine 5'-phosphate oxidase
VTSAPTPDSDPIALFLEWQAELVAQKQPYSDAVALATATKDGQPSARMLLLKGVVDGAFWFYTNYESRKANELEQNPHAALLFFWPSLECQIRVEGRVERLTAAESDRYFASRPRESQLSALVSPQSRVVVRDELVRLRAEAEERYADGPVPRPENWGGYRLIADSIEFWISRPSRFHDRHLFRRDGTVWSHVELAP